MNFVLWLIALVLLLICLVRTIPLKIEFLLDSTRSETHLKASWLSFLRFRADLIDMKVRLSVFIFSKKLFSKFIRTGGKGKRKKVGLLRALSLQDRSVKVFFGTDDPVGMGLSIGAVSLLGLFLGIEDFEQYPELFPVEDYLRIEARTNLNIGKTIANFLRQKNNKTKRRQKLWTK